MLQLNNKKFLLRNLIPTILLGIIFSSAGLARIPDFETTRMKSTGGTGVGSLLLDEATFLNPAPLAFFKIGSFYFQKSGTTITPSTQNDPYASAESDATAFVMSDSTGNMNGSISYQKQIHGFDERKRYGVSLATPLGKSSSMGMTYRRTKDLVLNDQNLIVNQEYDQAIFGFTHTMNSDVTMGMVFIDPFKKHFGDTKAIVGFQYVYKDFVTLMFDGGANYNENLSDSVLLRAAAQFKVMTDFFIRVGSFNDKDKKERGSGVGASWVQPKLMVDFAIKNSKVDEVEKYNQVAENIKETSFSLSYRF